MLSAKSWSHALWTTLITRCLLRKAAAVPLFPDIPRAAEGQRVPWWDACPLHAQPKGQRVFQREHLSFILRDQEAAVPGTCGHFEFGQGVAMIRTGSCLINLMQKKL